MQVQYRKLKLYKYKIDNEYIVDADIGLGVGAGEAEDYVSINSGGEMTLKEGYAWDGPSGPSIDTESFMRGSLVHDGYYQLMREDEVPRSCRKATDELLREMCIEDGMPWVRAWWVYLAVRLFAGKSSKPFPEIVSKPLRGAITKRSGKPSGA